MPYHASKVPWSIDPDITARKRKLDSKLKEMKTAVESSCDDLSTCVTSLSEITDRIVKSQKGY